MQAYPTFAALIAALLIASPAIGQPAPPAPEQPNALTRLMPLVEKGRSLCYVSTGAPPTFAIEDSPARKPPRTLTTRRFVFFLTTDQFPEDDTTNPPTPGKLYHGYALMADVAGRKKKLFAGGECGSMNMAGFGCSVECDGGSVYFEPVANGDALTMRISDMVRRFRMTWGCSNGEEDGTSVVLTHDPKTAVRFESADPKVCAPVAQERRKLFEE
jgi:hypothetical protein